MGKGPFVVAGWRVLFLVVLVEGMALGIVWDAYVEGLDQRILSVFNLF